MRKLPRHHRLCLALAAVALGSACVGEHEQPIVAHEVPEQDAPAPELITRVQLGVQGIAYAGVGASEQPAWGPTALAIDEQGRFWIADAVQHRVIAVDEQGKIVETVELEGVVSRIEDIAVADGQLYVLDTGAPAAAVLRVALDGGDFVVRELGEGLQLRDGLTGLAVDRDGAVLVELDFGDRLVAVLDALAQPIEIERSGYALAAGVLRAKPGDLRGSESSHGELLVDGQAIAEVVVPSSLAGLTVLGTAGELGDELLISVQELAQVDDALAVDETVRRYAADGSLLGEARFPLAEQFIAVEHPLALGPDGEVYALATRDDGIEILRLSFASGPVTRMLPAAPLRIADPEAEQQAGAATIGKGGPTPWSNPTCRTGASMRAVAEAYAGHLQSYSHTNVHGSCSERTKPSWLGVGAHVGVAYDWGGFDSISDYQAKLAQGHQAGDITSGGVYGCSVGIDCSGFVSRAWDTAWKYGTSTLPQISTVLASKQQGMITGDIFNRESSHVIMLLDYVGNSGVSVAESTTGGFDRVIIRTVGWSHLASYTPRRYENHCGYHGEADPGDGLPPPQGACGEVSEAGTCVGNTLQRCVDGFLEVIDCGAEATCDWDQNTSAHVCRRTDRKQLVRSASAYWIVDADGEMFAIAGAPDHGDFEDLGVDPAEPIIAAVAAGDQGYWMLGTDGGVFAFGSAGFFGSIPGLGVQLASPIADIDAIGSNGYWLVGEDGGVFGFGDAGYHGSLPELGVIPSAPIVALAATADGGGYWLAGADGGVFGFGNAGYFGSLPGEGIVPGAAIVDFEPTPSGGGYWLVGADGGVFGFGDAGFFGSIPGLAVELAAPIIDLEPSGDGQGYWLLGKDGGVFAFGSADYLGNALED